MKMYYLEKIKFITEMKESGPRCWFIIIINISCVDAFEHLIIEVLTEWVNEQMQWLLSV